MQVGLSERKLYILQPLHTGHMLIDTHTHTEERKHGLSASTKADSSFLLSLLFFIVLGLMIMPKFRVQVPEC